ncbi:hypothetical protein JQ609_19885 [Bradyrhizobium sp. AUGA SZCCT0169]|nr:MULTISPECIES: hypothetical protein [unclassified Bradyrhizobium]MBR1187248.1 hypothetical protein [Bradyrhizobium sp. AUGA SZCCT0160]MBR1249176.1 hypothetical protein [Bradyrhizobium sp. AUGA SZCCT0169]
MKEIVLAAALSFLARPSLALAQTGGPMMGKDTSKTGTQRRCQCADHS